jgi:hypothetical protein
VQRGVQQPDSGFVLRFSGVHERTNRTDSRTNEHTNQLVWTLSSGRYLVKRGSAALRQAVPAPSQFSL